MDDRQFDVPESINWTDFVRLDWFPKQTIDVIESLLDEPDATKFSALCQRLDHTMFRTEQTPPIDSVLRTWSSCYSDHEPYVTCGSLPQARSGMEMLLILGQKVRELIASSIDRKDRAQSQDWSVKAPKFDLKSMKSFREALALVVTAADLRELRHRAWVELRYYAAVKMIAEFPQEDDEDDVRELANFVLVRLRQVHDAIEDMFDWMKLAPFPVDGFAFLTVDACFRAVEKLSTYLKQFPVSEEVESQWAKASGRPVQIGTLTTAQSGLKAAIDLPDRMLTSNLRLMLLRAAKQGDASAFRTMVASRQFPTVGDLDSIEAHVKHECDVLYGASTPSPEPSKQDAATDRVKLFGPNEQPVVDGKKKLVLSYTEYRTVLALVKAGAIGLSKPELDKNAGGPDMRKYVEKLIDSDEDWAAVLRMAGKKGGRYRCL